MKILGAQKGKSARERKVNNRVYKSKKRLADAKR